MRLWAFSAVSGDEGLLLRPPGSCLRRVHMLPGASAVRGKKLC